MALSWPPPDMIHDADEMYAQCSEWLDGLIDGLVQDMKDRAAKGINDDAVSVMVTTATIHKHIEESGLGLNPMLLCIYQVAIYRLARQRILEEQINLAMRDKLRGQ